MSPEQAMALGDLDARTDIYSLGCVLFEMLAGEPPVASMTERRVHNWAALESSKALQGSHAGVARAVKHAISRALAPLPDDRFPTVTEFAAALGAPAYRTSVPTRGVLAGRWAGEARSSSEARSPCSAPGPPSECWAVAGRNSTTIGSSWRCSRTIPGTARSTTSVTWRPTG